MRFRKIACGVVLALISLVAFSPAARASDGIQSMTAAVCRGEMFLELEVISAKRSQTHRTFHNGIKRLIRNEYEVVCNVVKNETQQGPKTGSEITFLLLDRRSPIYYDFDGKVRTDVPQASFMWNNSFWGQGAKKGVKFFAAFPAGTNFETPVYPLVSRQIEERAAWDAAVVQHKQSQLFLEALSKTMPKHWKPSNNAIRVNCRPTRENVGRKVPFKPTGNPKEDVRQRELRVGIEYTITSPADESYAARAWESKCLRTSVRPTGPAYKARPYISSFCFVVFKKPYRQLPHQDPLPTPPSKWYRLELPQAVVYLDKTMKNTWGRGGLVSSQMPVLFMAIQKAVTLCNPPKEGA
jgi:hypothetical protein